mmetsp:Transcript_104655/g.312600  ORF Transcript_104655/g.312600 Transcript_104655/m.312600 type:complete len:303 (+) Transcript_104655:334-1242(+)
MHPGSLTLLVDPHAVGEEESHGQDERQRPHGQHRGAVQRMAESPAVFSDPVHVIRHVGVPLGSDLWVDHLEVEPAHALLVPVLGGHDPQRAVYVVQGIQEGHPERVEDDVLGRLADDEEEEAHRASDGHARVDQDTHKRPEGSQAPLHLPDLLRVRVGILDEHPQLHVHLSVALEDSQPVEGEAEEERHRHEHLEEVGEPLLHRAVLVVHKLAAVGVLPVDLPVSPKDYGKGGKHLNQNDGHEAQEDGLLLLEAHAVDVQQAVEVALEGRVAVAVPLLLLEPPHQRIQGVHVCKQLHVLVGL